MFCPQCGSLVTPPKAQFCQDCGCKLYKENKIEPEHQEKVFVPTKQKSVRLPLVPTRFGGILLVLFVIAWIGIYASVFIPAFAGFRPSSIEGYRSGQSGIAGFVIGHTILFYILFRRKNKKGWVGAIAGLVFGFVVLITADVIARTKQQGIDYILSHSPEYLAIQKFDPAMFQKMKSELATLATKPNISQQVVLSKLAPMMNETIQKALSQSSDDAIVQLARIKIANLEKVANQNENDCSAIFSNQISPEIQERIVAYIPDQNQKESSNAIVKVIENAVGRPQQPLNDSARLDRLMAPIEVKMHASGLSIKYLISDTPDLTPQKRCESGIHLFREALNLNDPDRAYLLRMLLTQWL